MGSWGSKLYQNDVAEDVRSEFKDLLTKGKSAEEITNSMIAGYREALNDPDDAPVFWCALADTQWNLGVLQDIVKENAISWIDRGADLAMWEAENPQSANARRKMYSDLKDKLRSPMPPIKEIKAPNIYRCEWAIGDTFAYEIENEELKEMGFKDVIFHKVDETIWYPGHIIPIVNVLLSACSDLPKNKEDLEQLTFLQSGIHTKANVYNYHPKQSKENLTIDEFGCYASYRVELLSTSKRIIPKKLIYLGRFDEIECPHNELIPDPIVTVTVRWKKMEQFVLNYYRWYNLRQAEFYQHMKKV